MWPRFVTRRPVSAVTIDFLAWCSAQLAAQGCTALLLIWDNAFWHRSQAVRPGYATIISRSSGVPRAGVSSSATCPAKVRGSTRLNRNGFMANGPWRNRTGC